MKTQSISEVVDTWTTYLRKEIEKEYGKLQGFDQPVPITSNQISALISCLGEVVAGLLIKNQQLTDRLDVMERELAIRQVRVSTAAAKKDGSN